MAQVLRASALERRTESLRCILGEIPRGALTEIAGPVSSGRTAFLYALLGAASANQEFYALIDTDDTFDPASAATAGVNLSQILWVRCGGNVEHALKAADLLTQAGGFGLVAVDLGDTPVKATRRISFGRWFRLRHGVENTKTALVSIGQQVNAHSCSALKIELRRDRVLWWRGLLNCLAITARCVKNHREQVGLPANIALASNPDAAVHVARGIKGTTVISPGEEATKLAPLPLRLLGGSRLHG